MGEDNEPSRDDNLLKFLNWLSGSILSAALRENIKKD